jgi:hypothetical protein
MKTTLLRELGYLWLSNHCTTDSHKVFIKDLYIYVSSLKETDYELMGDVYKQIFKFIYK